MKVIALRQLRGSYGLAGTGDPITVNDEVAKDLLKRKVVCLPGDYKAVKPAEKKVVKPAETKQRGGSRSTAKAQQGSQQELLPGDQPPAGESSEGSDEGDDE